MHSGQLVKLRAVYARPRNSAARSPPVVFSAHRLPRRRAQLQEWPATICTVKGRPRNVCPRLSPLVALRRASHCPASDGTAAVVGPHVARAAPRRQPRRLVRAHWPWRPPALKARPQRPRPRDDDARTSLLGIGELLSHLYRRAYFNLVSYSPTVTSTTLRLCSMPRPAARRICRLSSTQATVSARAATARASLSSATPTRRAKARATRTADAANTARVQGQDRARTAVRAPQASTKCSSRLRPGTTASMPTATRSPAPAVPARACNTCRQTLPSTTVATARSPTSGIMSLYSKVTRAPASTLQCPVRQSFPRVSRPAPASLVTRYQVTIPSRRTFLRRP